MSERDDASESTRDIAVRALTMIESHEKTCTERYNLIVKMLMGVSGSIAFLVLSKVLDYFLVTPVHH